MTEMEKVIKGLEEVQHYIKVENLPAHTLKAKLVIDDAIALLKAQEPVLVKPYTEVEYGFKPKVKVGECPNCGRIVNEQCNYCSKCGREVKWE